MKPPLLCMGDGANGSGCYRPTDHGPALMVSDEHWRAIAPLPEGGGVLCVSCMHDRFVALGFAEGSVPARFVSGPFAAAEAPPTRRQTNG